MKINYLKIELLNIENNPNYFKFELLRITKLNSCCAIFIFYGKQDKTWLFSFLFAPILIEKIKRIFK